MRDLIPALSITGCHNADPSPVMFGQRSWQGGARARLGPV